MKTSERDREKAALKAAQVFPVPLEQDILVELELLKIRHHRLRQRAQRLKASRDSWRLRALRGHK